jgi:hypothetical protein
LFVFTYHLPCFFSPTAIPLTSSSGTRRLSLFRLHVYVSFADTAHTSHTVISAHRCHSFPFALRYAPTAAAIAAEREGDEAVANTVVSRNRTIITDDAAAASAAAEVFGGGSVQVERQLSTLEKRELAQRALQSQSSRIVYSDSSGSDDDGDSDDEGATGGGGGGGGGGAKVKLSVGASMGIALFSAAKLTRQLSSEERSTAAVRSV